MEFCFYCILSLCPCQESIKRIIREEAVDWWLPVSHTTTAVTDTAVKTELEAEAAVVKVLAPDTVRVTEVLDDRNQTRLNLAHTAVQTMSRAYISLRNLMQLCTCIS